MPTASSNVDISNQALAMIGQKPILSFADQNELARQCSRWYDPMRRELLESCDWSFARNSARLNLIAAVAGFNGNFPDWASVSSSSDSDPNHDTAFPWAYVYKYPANVLYIHSVYALATGFGMAEEFMGYNQVEYTTWLQRMMKDYEIRRSRTTNQLVLCTNIPEAIAKYTRDITDTSQFTQKFCTALARRMAVMMVMPLNGDTEIKAQLEADAEKDISDAFRMNLSENPEWGPRTSSYEDTRGM